MMPLSHDSKPRNKARRAKGRKPNPTLQDGLHTAKRSEWRARSRLHTAAAHSAEDAYKRFLANLGLRWRDFEWAFDKAQAERRSLADILRSMAEARYGLAVEAEAA